MMQLDARKHTVWTLINDPISIIFVLNQNIISTWIISGLCINYYGSSFRKRFPENSPPRRLHAGREPLYNTVRQKPPIEHACTQAISGQRVPRREPIAATEKAIPDIKDRRYPRNRRGQKGRGRVVRRSPNLKTADRRRPEDDKIDSRASSRTSTEVWEDNLRDGKVP